MTPTSIIFSPTARVWNLRVLVVEIIAVCVFLVLVLPSGLDPSLYLPWEILFSTFGFILVHHLSLYVCLCLIISIFRLTGMDGSVFDWPMPCLAIIDLILIFIEVCGKWDTLITLSESTEDCTGIVAGFFFANDFIWTKKGIFPAPLRFAFVPLGLSLSISVTFRLAPIIRSNGRFFRQRFAFLGCCTPMKFPYTPMAIILNRSIARPLVR